MIRSRAKKDNELRCKNNRDQSEGISCSISRSNVFGLGNADERTERGSRCHTAGDRTEVVEKRKLENILCEEEADNHRNDRDDHTVYEVYSLEFCDEFCTAGDTGTDEEEHKTEFTEYLESACRRHNGNFADSCKMTKDKS